MHEESFNETTPIREAGKERAAIEWVLPGAQLQEGKGIFQWTAVVFR